jgi:acetolactate synthase regulatory subunit
MRHILSILLENEAGALSRVAGLFSARGYNIESLTVAPTEDPSLSRMTLVTRGSEEIIEQITKQLNKLVDVVRLLELTTGPHLEREILLVKVPPARSTSASPTSFAAASSTSPPPPTPWSSRAPATSWTPSSARWTRPASSRWCAPGSRASPAVSAASRSERA